jgi:hypothetical protein
MISRLEAPRKVRAGVAPAHSEGYAAFACPPCKSYVLLRFPP